MQSSPWVYGAENAEGRCLRDAAPPALRTALAREGRELPRIRLGFTDKPQPEAFWRAAESTLPEKTLLVADEVTCKAADFLRTYREKTMHWHIFPWPVHADMETAEALREQAQSYDALLAVGSGSINDLCKYIAATTGKPYGVYATAASMNGYLSPTASLTVGGHKQSLPATLPILVWSDAQTLASAPKRMALAGLGDSLCRKSCLFDQWLAEQLLEQRFDRTAHIWPEVVEPVLWDKASALKDGDTEAMRLLFEALLAGGVSMLLAGSSAPASQSEHMLAHLMDMAYEITPSMREGGKPYHGEAVAVATISSLHWQAKLLKKRPNLYIRPADPRWFKGLLDEETMESCLKLYAKKQAMLPDEVTLNARWRQLDAGLAEGGCTQRPNAGDFRKLYDDVGVPRHPRQVHWPLEMYAQARQAVAMTRDRFTIWDIAWMAPSCHPKHQTINGYEPWEKRFMVRQERESR